jgi:N-acetylglucosamine-6-phosphate deacetylase
MPEISITARRLVTPSGVLDFPVVTVADGFITSITSDPAHKGEGTLCAASLDVHTHGAVGHDVMSAAPAELGAMQRFLAQRGVAHYLPTTVTAPVDATLRALESLADAVEREAAPSEAKAEGIHLEGPFLSHAKRGVHPVASLQRPTVELFTRFWQAARGHIRVMTIAPELDGAEELIAHATALGVRCSMGHSNATTAEALRGIAAGAASATHTFNAMRALDHREPGVLGVVLAEDALFAELICDGVHVAPECVRLWWRAKGRERAILITDAMSAAGSADGEYSLGGLRVRVADGRALLADDFEAGKETLAGSVLTMDAAVENFVRITGVSAGEAARLASAVPAAMLGEPELAAVRVGGAANLNRLDEDGRLIETWIRGQAIAR